MKNNTLVNVGIYSYIGISLLGLASVSLLSLINPQSTMDLVHVKLENNDALSSIRGIYGGAGLAIIIGVIYLTINQIHLALRFITIFWGAYALSRLITIIVNGPLGDFGNNWIAIETALSIIGMTLIFFSRHSK